MSRHQPVSHTCPDIDKCQTLLKEARAWLSHAVSYVERIQDISESNEVSDLAYEVKECIIDARNCIDFDQLLEELRDANSSLRDWAYELREEIEQIESNLQQ